MLIKASICDKIEALNFEFFFFQICNISDSILMNDSMHFTRISPLELFGKLQIAAKCCRQLWELRIVIRICLLGLKLPELERQALMKIESYYFLAFCRILSSKETAIIFTINPRYLHFDAEGHSLQFESLRPHLVTF